MLGGNGKSLIMDAELLPGYDPYRYPDNLPIDAAKGGEGGKPGCGSLPDVAKNFPVRQLIANTGFGTGLDWRPNPASDSPPGTPTTSRILGRSLNRRVSATQAARRRSRALPPPVRRPTAHLSTAAMERPLYPGGVPPAPSPGPTPP